MKTECSREKYEFQGINRKKLVCEFNGGMLTSDGGAALLAQVESRLGIIKQFAECFVDHRNQDMVEHTLSELLLQRIFGIALGYEDLNDHDDLRMDHYLAALSGKADPTGQDRKKESDKGKPLAGKSTLSRLENTPAWADSDSRYSKIVIDPEKVDRFFVDIFLQSFKKLPKQIVLDFDATDDPLHGRQEWTFYHGYYRCYCYMPLYVFCGDHLLLARLRPSSIDGSEGTVEELRRLVGMIRESWPEVKIMIRGDSGFCREKIMVWCEEAEDVDYVFGLAQNSRLKKEIESELSEAEKICEETGESARVFKDFTYQTHESWSIARRVVGKAEHLSKGSNPRFIVTSLSIDEIKGQKLYEDVYCARGDMENRIKEQQLDLFADRTSCPKMRANQIRVWFSSVAYLLMEALRRLGLKNTEMEKAQCGTIRLKLLKIGAQVKVSVRRVHASLANNYPHAKIFDAAYANIQRITPARC